MRGRGVLLRSGDNKRVPLIEAALDRVIPVLLPFVSLRLHAGLPRLIRRFHHTLQVHCQCPSIRKGPFGISEIADEKDFHIIVTLSNVYTMLYENPTSQV